MSKRVTLSLTAIALLSAPMAVAQATTSDAQPAEAPTEQLGLRIGEGRLHPYLEVDGRYDSSAFGACANGVPGCQSPDIVVRFRPGVRFELDTSSLLINFGGNAEYALYTGAFNKSTAQASHFAANLGLDTAFNRNGVIEFDLSDSLSRSPRANNPVVTAPVLSFINTVRVAIPIRPGGGAFEITPRGSYSFEFFDPWATSTATVSDLNYHNVSAGGQIRWRFFPKTALLLNSDVDLRLFNNPTLNKSATLWKTQAGLLGLITSKISITALVGWAYDFQLSGANSIIAQAEFAFLPSESMSFRIGYLRSFNPAGGTFGTFGSDRGYAAMRLFFFNRLTLSLTGGVEYLTYYAGNPLGGAAVAGRYDLVADVGPTVQVDITKWFYISANYALAYRSSNAANASFMRHEAGLKVGVQY